MKSLFLVFMALTISMVSGCAKKGTGDIVATVNGTPITVAMMETKIEKLPQYYQTFAVEHKNEIVNEMIVEELLYNEAKKRKLDRDPDIKNLINDATKKILISMIVEEQVKKSAPVSEDDVKAYYENNKEKYVVPEMIKASHILTSTQEEAEKAKGELDRGAEFAAVAQEYSKDLTKDRGGDLGYFSKGQMIPEFEKTAFGLNIGQTSGIIKTRFGYHIIKLTDRKPAVYQSFDDVKDTIMTSIIRDSQRKSFDEFTNKLKDKAKISIDDKLVASLNKNEPAAEPPAALPTEEKVNK